MAHTLSGRLSRVLSARPDRQLFPWIPQPDGNATYLRGTLILLWILEPSRNDTACINHPPYVDMVVSSDVEVEPRKTGEPTMSQPRQVQLMCATRRTNAGMLRNRTVGCFEPIDETERDV